MRSLVTLHQDATLKDVTRRLKALGQWTRPVRNPDGEQALVIEDNSQAVPDAVLRDVPGVASIWSPAPEHPLLDNLAGPEWKVERGNASVRIGGAAPPLLAAGPCAADSEEVVHQTAALVAEGGGRILRGGAFKPRTSPYSFSGHGREALSWLRDAADTHDLLVLTEVLGESDVDVVGEVADIFQIGSRNMQNFALLHAIGRNGKPAMLKRGMNATLKEWRLAAEHLLNAGCPNVIFCERGLRNADGETRNLLDLGGAALLKHAYGLTVFVDPSHAAGRRDLILPLARAALAAGVDGILVETHVDPGRALSDGPQALSRDEFLAVGDSVAQAAALRQTEVIS